MTQHDPRWYLRKDGIPPPDDENDYVWTGHQWAIDNGDEPEIDEDALERYERRRVKRIEWETYHPGVPCPACELED